MEQQNLTDLRDDGPTTPTPTPEPLASDDLLRYFPPIASPLLPMEDRVVVQLRKPPLTAYAGSSLILGTGDRDTERWNQCVGKILALGKQAVETAAEWDLSEGDYVRIPVYGGDRIEVPCPDEYRFQHVTKHVKDDADIILVTIRIHEVLSKITVDPREIKTFLPTKKYA